VESYASDRLTIRRETEEEEGNAVSVLEVPAPQRLFEAPAAVNAFGPV